MMRLGKAVAWLAGVSILAVAGSWAYVSAKTFADVEALLLCSQGRDELVPKEACRAFLFTFGLDQTDVERLNHGIGVGWVIRAENERDRIALLDYLLENGVDIDAVDGRSGITALHTAVLENDLQSVELLLKSGARPDVQERDKARTPLDFAIQLQGQPNQPDRTAIIDVLEKATARPSVNQMDHRAPVVNEIP